MGSRTHVHVCNVVMLFVMRTPHSGSKPEHAGFIAGRVMYHVATLE